MVIGGGGLDDDWSCMCWGMVGVGWKGGGDSGGGSYPRKTLIDLCTKWVGGWVNMGAWEG